jgi:hypothetical protein
MYEYKLTVTTPRPYFAEFPYALWGEVNYDSDGDCRRPTDREWTQLEIMHRGTRERLVITGSGQEFSIKAKDRSLAARAAMFFAERSGATIIGEHPQARIGIWSYTNAYAATARIRAEFPRPELIPFDSHLFWGSWKWVGLFATDLTWMGRWIMNSLLTRDTRAVELCIYWLKAGTTHPDQSAALRHALQLLTRQQFATDQEWITWYDDKGYHEYPKPDFEAWFDELKGS